MTRSSDFIPNYPRILHVDADIVAAFKPSGMHTHPVRDTDADTLLHFVGLQHPDVLVPQNPDKKLEGGLVHRLDQGTSGVVVFARNKNSWITLREHWKKKQVQKFYLAWTNGIFPFAEPIRIDLFLEHDPKSKKRMRIAETASGLKAETSFQRLKAYEKSSLVLIQIHTGVMHQIRVVLAFLGTPVLGDPVYLNYGLKAHYQKDKFKSSWGQSPALKESLFSSAGLDGVGLAQRLSEPRGDGLPEHGFFLHAQKLFIPSTRPFDVELPDFWK